jgi:hypothetical protein
MFDFERLGVKITREKVICPNGTYTENITMEWDRPIPLGEHVKTLSKQRVKGHNSKAA